LVVAIGAEPVRPPIPGLEHEGVHQLHTIGDARLLDEVLARRPERAVIVGAGYIGLEMAEALRARRLDVTLVEQLPAVFPTVDRELGELVRFTYHRLLETDTYLPLDTTDTSRAGSPGRTRSVAIAATTALSAPRSSRSSSSRSPGPGSATRRRQRPD
jgi:pyruvate/2-oxoglutarate dehydrogenase complex dihydrolipoamide dehydrogenase (E3) component